MHPQKERTNGKKQSCKPYEGKKITYRRLEELSDIVGETINRARGALIHECKLSTLDALARLYM